MEVRVTFIILISLYLCTALRFKDAVLIDGDEEYETLNQKSDVNEGAEGTKEDGSAEGSTSNAAPQVLFSTPPPSGNQTLPTENPLTTFPINNSNVNENTVNTPTISQQQAQPGCFSTFSQAFQNLSTLNARNAQYRVLRDCLVNKKCNIKRCNKRQDKCLARSGSDEEKRYKCNYKWFNCVSKKCPASMKRR